MDDKEHVISMLRACVLSTKNDITLRMLKLDYIRLVGSEIPYQALGYKSLESFIESIPDLKIQRGSDGYPSVSAAPTERSQHIVDLVSRQKSPVKKISPPKAYTSPDRRNAASWTSPYNPSYYKPKEESDHDKSYEECGYKGRDSYGGHGSYRSSSDRYNSKGNDYYKEPRENNACNSSDHSLPRSKMWLAHQGPDRYNDRNYYKHMEPKSPIDSANTSMSENWDEQSVDRNAPTSPEAKQPSEECTKEKLKSPICAGSELSAVSASTASSKMVATDAKPVTVEQVKKLPEQTTAPSLRSRLSGPTPAQLRLNAQRKAALKKAEEEAQNSARVTNVTESLDSLSVESKKLIEMVEEMPFNVSYYSRLMMEHITEQGLPQAEVVVTSRLISNINVYCCELKLGVVSVTSFPFENIDSDVVVDYACREVLRALNQVRLPVEVHTSQPKEVQHRLLRMIFLHPRGIWNTSLPRLYSVAFKEPIPSNWMDVVHNIDKSQVQVIQSQNAGVFILKPNLVGINILSNEPTTPPTLQPAAKSRPQQNPAMSLLMQGVTKRLFYNYSMPLPVPAAQTVMPMPMNMRLNPRMRTPVFNNMNNPLASNAFGPVGMPPPPGVRPRMGRGRGSRNIDPAESIFNSPLFLEQCLMPIVQETSSVPSLCKEALGNLEMPESNSSAKGSSSLELGPPIEQSTPLTGSPIKQLNTVQVITDLSGSETASSATMSLPTLSPVTVSPELVSKLVIENVKAHNMAGKGISENLTLPQDDAWDVQVTAANSIHEVWVRLIGDFHSVAYNNMAADMEIYYMNLSDNPVVAVQPKLGSYYAIQLESCWHRVKLVELPQAENDGVTLFFIDQGDEEKYPFSMCHFLDHQFMNLPGQAVHCHLAFMEMFQKDVRITEHLINMLVGNCFVANVLSVQNSKAYIVLYNIENNADININHLVVEKLAESLKPSDLNEVFQVGSVIEVLLSHVTSDATVYIQILDTAYYCIQYMTYQLTNYPMKKVNKTIIPLRIGEVYLARFNLEEDLLRVVIKSKPEDREEVVVHYIDYGFMELIPIKFLLRATDFAKAIQDIPPLAKNVKLSNLPPSRFTSQMASRLRSLVPNSVSALAKILKRPDEDLAEVELFKRIQPDNLLVSVNNTLLLDPRLATPEEPCDKGEAATQKKFRSALVGKPYVNDPKAMERLQSIKQTFKLLTIPNIGEEFDLHVAMASNPSNFTVQPWSQNQQLDQMMQEMQEVYDNQVHDELTVDDIVPGGVYAALNSSDNHWYRATVSRKMGSFDKAAIFVCFNDFGDFNIVPLERIKMLDACFKELPVQAIKAKLSDVGPVHADWSVEACLFFQKLVNQREFVSIVMENGPDILNPSDTVIGLRLIDTSSDKDVYIDKLLVDKGHAIYIDKTDK